MRRIVFAALALATLTSCDGARITIEVPARKTDASMHAASTPSTSIVSHEQYPDFSVLPLAEKVHKSSAIVVGRMVGDPPKCLVAEVLKAEEPNTQFVVGQPLPLCKQPSDPTYLPQEAQLHFYAGKPATFRYSVSVYEGHIPAMQGQPLQRVREEILVAVKR
jgi:hypothetical protein